MKTYIRDDKLFSPVIGLGKDNTENLTVLFLVLGSKEAAVLGLASKQRGCGMKANRPYYVSSVRSRDCDAELSPAADRALFNLLLCCPLLV